VRTTEEPHKEWFLRARKGGKYPAGESEERNTRICEGQSSEGRAPTEDAKKPS